jgi:hypothetical protein
MIELKSTIPASAVDTAMLLAIDPEPFALLGLASTGVGVSLLTLRRMGYATLAPCLSATTLVASFRRSPSVRHE